MKKSDILRKEIADLTDAAEALVNVAEQQNRELSADEQVQWSAIMAKDTGSLAKKEAELKAALEHEAEIARLRAAREVVAAPPVYSPQGGQAGTDGAMALPANVRVLNPHLTAFKGNDSHRDAYDCGLWFKAVLLRDPAARERLVSRRGEAWLATSNETSESAGGALVPAPLQAGVIYYRSQVGVSRRLARVIPMTSDSHTFVKQTSSHTVYYPAEEAAITASSPAFQRVSLVAKKRAVLSYCSSELRDDAMIPIMDLLASDMGYSLALQEDKEFVLGDGSSSYGGVQGVKSALTAATASLSSAATNNDTWPEITYADLAKAMALVPEKYRGLPMAWLCSAAFKWQVFDRLVLAQGGALSLNMVDGVPQAMFAGYPIVVTDQMPTTTAAATLCAIFGAFQNAVLIGDRNEVRIATSEHVAFTTDQIAVRATVRYDLNVHEEGTTAAAGAIAGFKTAS